MKSGNLILKPSLGAALLLVSLSALSANAAFVGLGGRVLGSCGSADQFGTDLCTLLSTTTSLPTIIVAGEKLALDSAEASERLLAEAYGDADPLIISTLVAQLNRSLEEVKATVVAMADQGETVSVAAVLQKLAK